MSWKATMREMSEPHDFDPDDFKAGDFATGVEYKTEMSAKDELQASIRDSSESRVWVPDIWVEGVWIGGREYKLTMMDKGMKGTMEESG